MGFDGTSREERRRVCKVNRLITENDLSDVVSELERRRRGKSGEVHSLRDLAEFFNRTLLERRLSKRETPVLAGEVDNLYRLLTDDDVSSGDRTRARSHLERAGIDIDQLERDFVSREAIRTFLKRQDISRPHDDVGQVEKEDDRIRQLRTRTATVTETKVDHLRSTGRISLGDFRVLVDIQVFCEDCNTQLDIDQLLDRRTCKCPSQD